MLNYKDLDPSPSLVPDPPVIGNLVEADRTPPPNLPVPAPESLPKCRESSWAEMDEGLVFVESPL